MLVWHSTLTKENCLRWHILIQFIDNNTAYFLHHPVFIFSA